MNSTLSRRLLVLPAVAAIAAGLLAAAPANAATPTALLSGTTLASGQSLASPDGFVTLVMQTDGNLVAYAGGHWIWNSHTEGNDGAHLSQQTDGNLVIYSTTNTPLWQSHTRSTGNHLVVQDDGNLVEIGPTGTPVWNAGSHATALSSGATLAPGQSLVSSDDAYRLVMQTDGNLVLYKGNTALWNSGTRSTANTNSHLTLQSDGNLVIYTPANTAAWNSHTDGNGPSTLALQTDGNLVLYTNNGNPTWNTQTRQTAPPSSVGGAITRSEVLQRAHYWLDVVKPAYDQSNTHVPDPQGRDYRADCSGFVSMAWHLSSSYDTWNLDPAYQGGTGSRAFVGLTHIIARDALQPGDALVNDATQDHIVLFAGWADSAHVNANIIEEGNPQTNMNQDTWDLDASEFSQYTPIAYNNITAG